MKTRRTGLAVALLVLSVFALSCTDQVVINGFTTDCIGTKDKPMKATLNIDQEGADGAVASALIRENGEVDFAIGARNQPHPLLHSGHAPTPPAKRDPNTVYTGDPVTITLKVQPPCTFGTKKFTGVLDDLHEKRKYVLSVDKFH
jgi:hypothetical protein